MLVDWENVQPNEAECRALVPEATDVWLFHGPNQRNVGRGYATFGDRVTEVRIARAGKNALDFHLSFYMGYIASKHPDARFVVLSNDKGYGPMLDHAKELGFVASQSGFGAARVGRTGRSRGKKAPAKKAAAKAVQARKTSAAPAKKVAAKKAPAAKDVARKAAPTPAPAPPPTPAPAVARTATAAAKKSFDQVLAILKKSPAASRPRKHARLLAYVAREWGPGPRPKPRRCSPGWRQRGRSRWTRSGTSAIGSSLALRLAGAPFVSGRQLGAQSSGESWSAATAGPVRRSRRSTPWPPRRRARPPLPGS